MQFKLSKLALENVFKKSYLVAFEAGNWVFRAEILILGIFSEFGLFFNPFP